MAAYKQGIYNPVHPEKYIGDFTKIVYRSSWELRFLKWCDSRENVISYSSEETIVPYYSPLDQKNHRYFVDFLINMKHVDGTVKTLLIEIKPAAEISKPKQPKTNNRKSQARYTAAISTYITNQCKWEAATMYASTRGWQFIVMDEYSLGIAKRKK